MTLISNTLFKRMINLDKDECPLPEIIEIEPTNTCNLRCKMCHVRFMQHDDIKYFDVQLLKKLSALKEKWFVVGSNFEASMHPHFVDIMKGLSDMNCKIDLTTNGTMIRKEIADNIKDCNIKNLTISFDSVVKKTYEIIRKGARFESALEQVLYFRNSLKKNSAFVAINSVLMRSNISELIEMIDFWNSNDFQQLRLIFMVIRSLNDDVVKESLYPIRKYAFEKLDEAATYILNNNQQITLTSPYFNYSEIKNLYPNNVCNNVVKSDSKMAKDYFNPRHYFLAGKYPGMKVNCRSPFAFARILYNGDVELCFKYIIGNLNKKSFVDIWYGKQAQHIRSLVLSDSQICFKCDYYRFCLCSNSIDINDKRNYFQQNLIHEDVF